jgi:hypothetical protein
MDFLRKITPYALGAVLLALVAARFFNLTADPPSLFVKFSGSLLTDPYYYTYFARNAVLFGDWTPFGYDRYTVFMHSLVSCVSFVVFLLAGVSRLTANLAGLLLHLGGVAFFIAAVYHKERSTTAWLTAFFLLSCVSLFFFGRYPLLENGMLFLIGFASFVFLRYHHTLIGLFATGVLVTLAALAGKLTAAMLFGPVFIAFFAIYRRESILPLLVIFGAAVITASTYLLVFFGGSVSEFLAYLSEVSATVNQYSGLTMPDWWLGSIVSYLAMPHFTWYHAALVIAGMCGCALFVLSPRTDFTQSERMAAVFCLTWIVLALVILSPMNYRPMRHGLLLFFPIAFFAGLLSSRLLTAKVTLQSVRWWHWLTMWLCTLLVGSVVLALVFEKHAAGVLIREWALCITAGSLALSLAMFKLLPGKKLLRRTSTRALAVVILVAVIAQSGYFIYQGLSRPKYEILRLNREIAELFGDDAVLTGNFAPALSTDNALPGVFEYFGPVTPDRDLFKQYPISHVATNIAAWPTLEAQFGLRGKSIPLFTHTVQAFGVRVGMIQRRGYAPSLYEQSLIALSDSDYLHGLELTDKLMAQYPENGTLMITRLLFMLNASPANDAIREIDHLSQMFPHSLYVQYSCAQFAGAIYNVTSVQVMRNRAQRFLDNAIALDSRFEMTVEELLEQSRQL